MDFFKKYKTKENKDGSFNVLEVPIFKLGKHRGFDYNKEWFEKAKANHIEGLKEGYLPSAIVGHDGTEEKESVGFLDNLKLKGQNILADITKISPEFFEKIKKRAFPHRSIEVHPEKAKISALALLGGTEPYHKLPVLEVFGEEKEGAEYFDMEDENELTIKEEVAVSEELKKVRDTIEVINRRLWGVDREGKTIDEVIEGIEKIMKEAREALASLKNNEKKEEGEEKEMGTKDETTQEDFKEKFKEQQNETLKLQKQLKETENKAFFAELPDNLAPAIVGKLKAYFKADDKVKFADEDEAEISKEDALKQIIKDILEYAKEHKLMPEMDEKAKKGGEDKKADDFKSDDADVESFAEIKKIQEEKGISFEEAYTQFLNK